MAAALLERGLRGTEGNAVRAAQILAPLVDARLACGDVVGAREAAEQLAAFAHASGIRLIGGRADLAAARVAIAADDDGDAAESAHRALTAFGALAMPFDVGEARLELARAIATQTPEIAVDEARTAVAAFRELGASRAMDAAAALLRDLGGATGGRAAVASPASSPRASWRCSSLSGWGCPTRGSPTRSSSARRPRATTSATS